VTEKQAQTTANVVMAAAALGAAVFVLRSPKLRRLAWQMARQYATGPLAFWTSATVRQAWQESAVASRTDRHGLADRPAPAGKVGEAVH
jgi:hypothetical protein